ncbi:hypothetical protein I6E81_03210 [Salinibacterium sp. NG22]|uniref:hypothetical protein n=1 Tax=Salinibacterium sp. NG22 TaxID=2792040 RepID=UPI0018CCD6E2|nr:hypothetical protein [Salinibacterium sp. NG22]MBH0109169.1 hypothetical protein [Salinibacterium sp. NG22]
MTTHTTFTKSTIIAVALATTLSLSGCFANPIDQLTDKIGSGIAEEGAEKLIEGATGSDIDIEANGTMPQDFPDEVPIIEGKIESAVGLTIEGQQTWTVTFIVDDAKSSVKAARKMIVEAGFEETLWSDSYLIAGMFSNDAYQISVSTYADEDEQRVMYQVFENVTDE